jgi:SPP1 family predicted phage head-tail adaptor
MRAGTLRDRIVLEESVPMQDSTGDTIPTWVPRTIVWASIEPLTGREAVLLAAQGASEMNTRICIRWTPTLNAVTPTWRVRFGTILYNIKSIINKDNANRELEMMCQSGVNTG